ncbi:hypothetical protein TSAR_004498, partial [Trichomalopsis sarcophagae]
EIHKLKEKVKSTTDLSNCQLEITESAMNKIKKLETERAKLESKVLKMEAELTSYELSQEILRQDKNVR